MIPRITTITLNPAIDQTIFISGFHPGEVNRVQFEQSDPAGKGVNVASFLSDFGIHCAVTGFLGADNSNLFERFFAEKKIQDEFLRIPGKTRVNIKIVDGATHEITDINFPGASIETSEIDRLFRALDEISGYSDLFVISGSTPTGIPSSIYKDIVTSLNSRGKNVMLDASGESLRKAIEANPAFVKPNLSELRELVGKPLNTEAEVLDASKELIRSGIETVVVSMGSDGALFVQSDEALRTYPPAVEVKSTVGAGDAMVAGWITGRVQNLTFVDCAKLATAFSVGAVTQMGPRLPAKTEVEALIEKIKVSVA